LTGHDPRAAEEVWSRAALVARQKINRGGAPRLHERRAHGPVRQIAMTEPGKSGNFLRDSFSKETAGFPSFPVKPTTVPTDSVVEFAQ
jgi:hypothetical protein